MGTRNIRCISNFRVSAFSDLHHKNKKLSSNEWADRPPDRDKTGRRYRQNPRMSHAFYYEGSCKPSSHARGLDGSRRQTGEHTCVGRSFVIRFRELCAKLLCITHRASREKVPVFGEQKPHFRHCMQRDFPPKCSICTRKVKNKPQIGVNRCYFDMIENWVKKHC